jgi:hypothetical protein
MNLGASIRTRAHPPPGSNLALNPKLWPLSHQVVENFPRLVLGILPNLPLVSPLSLKPNTDFH